MEPVEIIAANPTEITSVTELEAVVGMPIPRVAQKHRPTLDPVDIAWMACSPFVLIATSSADGRCDVSPKGDPPGTVRVLDECTLAVPERPGNKRMDGYRNLLSNPHVGLLFLIPGRGETLRVNGRARLRRAAPYLEEMTVNGNRPALALEVRVEEVFFHCARAFQRSGLWNPDSWSDDPAPTAKEILATPDRPEMPAAELDRYYGPGYAARLRECAS